MTSTSSVSNLESSGFLSECNRARAIQRLYEVIAMFGTDEIKIKPDQYNRVKLVKFTYEYSCNQLSKDMFLFDAYVHLGLSFYQDNIEPGHDFKTRLYGFADHLIKGFYLLLKASTENKPQPNTASYSACLKRDRHRCVVSRKFDVTEAMERYDRHGEGGAVDDDGTRLFGTGYNLDSLVATNILPQSLTTLDSSGEPIFANTCTRQLLNMLDGGVADLIGKNGSCNRLTLTATNHFCFSNFRMYFEPVEEAEHTYVIKTFLPPAINQPVTRTLFLAEDTSIDLPSARLLALHRAVAHILHLSGAGAYIYKKLDERSNK